MCFKAAADQFIFNSALRSCGVDRVDLWLEAVWFRWREKDSHLSEAGICSLWQKTSAAQSIYWLSESDWETPQLTHSDTLSLCKTHTQTWRLADFISAEIISYSSCVWHAACFLLQCPVFPLLALCLGSSTSSCLLPETSRLGCCCRRRFSGCPATKSPKTTNNLTNEIRKGHPGNTCTVFTQPGFGSTIFKGI